MEKVRKFTDAKGCKLIDHLTETAEKLKKSLVGGVDSIDLTLRLLTGSQPVRRKLFLRIKDLKLRATYSKIIKNVDGLLAKNPKGQSGIDEINASLKKAIRILRVSCWEEEENDNKNILNKSVLFQN